jgi:TetR/AcrR family transcriptional regulator, mexJK operon transcriptional repressor
MKKKAGKKTPGRPGRLSAEQTAELPKRLLDAALALFNRQGFSATTMEEVAREAGASTKTLYSRYANKTELARAVGTRMVDENLAMHAAATSPDPKQVDPRQFLTVLGRGVLMRLGGEGAGMIRIAFSEARHFPELVQLYEDVMTRASGNIANALRAWKEQGLLPGLSDTQRAARLCISMMTDTARIRIGMGGTVTDDDIKTHIPFAVELFLRGLGYRLS